LAIYVECVDIFVGFFQISQPKQSVYKVFYPFDQLILGKGDSMIGLSEDFFSKESGLTNFEEKVALGDRSAIAFMFLKDVMF
jgi:hypothetical protein